MKANECVRMPVPITSKEKPHLPMHSVQSFLLFAIVPAELKFENNMANFESVFMPNDHVITASIPTFTKLNLLVTLHKLGINLF